MTSTPVRKLHSAPADVGVGARQLGTRSRSAVRLRAAASRVRAGTLLVALPLFVALIAGCATVGWEFPVANVDKIVIGQTTRDEVQKLFGNPWRVGVEDGHETWTYGHYKYKVFGQSKSRDLLVRFNENNIVRSYTFNTTEKEDRPQKP